MCLTDSEAETEDGRDGRKTPADGGEIGGDRDLDSEGWALVLIL